MVLDLESEAMRGPGSIPTRGNISFSKFCNPNLHNIARSDSLGFKTKNPIIRNILTLLHQSQICVSKLGRHYNVSWRMSLVLPCSTNIDVDFCNVLFFNFCDPFVHVYVSKQECIPVGCVPPAAVAIRWGVCFSACWDKAPLAQTPQLPSWVWAWRPPWPDPSTSPLGVGLDTCKACWDTTPLLQGMLEYQPAP